MAFFCSTCMPRKTPRPLYPLSTERENVYKLARRNQSQLLRACWEKDWTRVSSLCGAHRGETFVRTSDTGRTALHLATMPGSQAPDDVIYLLLEANPHALLIHDSHRRSGTPLHFICGSVHRENGALIQRAVELAQEMTVKYPLDQPLGCSWSPFYVACRKLAPLGTLDSLLKEGAHSWIAPSIGAETEHLRQGTYLSPLLELWNGLHVHFRQLDKASMQTIRAMTNLLIADPQIPVTRLIKPETNGSVRAWLTLFLLLRTQVRKTLSPSVTHLLVKLYQPIAALLQLSCFLFAEELLVRTCDGKTVLQLLLDRTDLPSLTSASEMICHLIEASPELLIFKDSESLMYPVLSAASYNNISLDCIYQMITRSPQVLLAR